MFSCSVFSSICSWSACSRFLFADSAEICASFIVSGWRRKTRVVWQLRLRYTEPTWWQRSHHEEFALASGKKLLNTLQTAGEKLVWPFTQPWPPPLLAPLHWKVCWTLSSVQVIWKWCGVTMALLLISPPDAEEIPRVCVWSNCPDIDERVGDNGPALNASNSLRWCTSSTLTHAGLDFLPLHKKPTKISQVVSAIVCSWNSHVWSLHRDSKAPRWLENPTPLPPWILKHIFLWRKCWQFILHDTQFNSIISIHF